MADKKKKPQEQDEVSDEQLQDAAGGFLERFPNVPVKKEPPLNKSMEREGTIEDTA